MTGFDKYPCGLKGNEKKMSTTAMAYAYSAKELRQAENERYKRAKDPVGYKAAKARAKRRQRLAYKEKIKTLKRFGYMVEDQSAKEDSE